MEAGGSWMGLGSSEGFLAFALRFLPFFDALSILLSIVDILWLLFWPRCYVDHDWRMFFSRLKGSGLFVFLPYGERFSKRWWRLLILLFLFYS